MAKPVEKMFDWDVISDVGMLAGDTDYVGLFKGTGEGAARHLVPINTLVSVGAVAAIATMTDEIVTFGTVYLTDDPIATMADVTVVGALVIADSSGAATTVSTQAAVDALQAKLDALIADFNSLKNQFITPEPEE